VKLQWPNETEVNRLLDDGIAANIDGARDRQLSFYGEECDPEFEISRPHGCGRLYEFLIEHKFRTGLRVLGLEMSGRSVLEVCCGSGMMAEKFARAGAAVTGIDFSPAAVARARASAEDELPEPAGGVIPGGPPPAHRWAERDPIAAARLATGPAALEH